MMRLDGKRAVITGAAQGIGLATARRFIDEGADLLMVDRPAQSDIDLAELATDGVTYLAGDVTDDTTLEAIEAYALDGGLDILVNNAGITRDASLTKMSVEQWDAVIDVNLKAVFRLAQLAARLMQMSGGGVILNAASVVAHYGNFGQANYVASKAGVIGLTKTLAKELGRHRIRVNAVAPGFIETPMTAAVPAKVIDTMQAKIPLGRMGRADDIAAAYAFLASDEARYITGATLNVDGGLVIG